MANPAGTTAKPIRSMLDGAVFLGIDHGRSVTPPGDARDGILVSFTTPFNSIPVVTLGPHSDKKIWIDPALVSVSEFTWYASVEEAGIDWIAIGT